MPDTRIRVQSWDAGPVIGVALEAAVATRWPRVPGQVAQGAYRVLCIAPTDWLLLSTAAAEATLTALKESASDSTLTFVDLSQGLSHHALAGERARDVLSKGSGVDFHPRAFSAGHCVRTRIAHMPVIVDCASDDTRLECYVPRSYSLHFASWLGDASIELEK